MARQRMIRPEIWESEQIIILSDFQFRIYIGLISHADDEGRLKGNPALLAAKIFPATMKMDTAKKVRAAIECMEEIRLIAVYGDADVAYIAHPNWSKWQYVPKAHLKKSPLPKIPKRNDYETNRKLVTAFGYGLMNL